MFESNKNSNRLSNIQMISKNPAIALALIGMLNLTACSSNDTLLKEAPKLAEVTGSNKLLREIPAPEKRISVAVYNFSDLTGQFKESVNGNGPSSAVTQGGSSILIKALQDAGERRWFTVLERSQLANLLKERQILIEMRRLYRNEEDINAKVLPPLKHASIIIEGGIVGYNSNFSTGGVGAHFLGIGGDTKYAKDEVTVSLRAVSTKTGEVLVSVTVRKTVASTSLHGDVFRYVTLNKLLEVEAGITNNEPIQIAVESAIEKAVQALIVEGALLNIWKFKSSALGAEYITGYNKEKYGEVDVVNSDVIVKPETAAATSLIATVPYKPQAATLPETTQTIRKIEPEQPELPPAQSASEKPVG